MPRSGTFLPDTFNAMSYGHSAMPDRAGFLLLELLRRKLATFGLGLRWTRIPSW